MTDQRVVSGIRPTGNVHLGNYLGSIKNAVALQDNYSPYLFIADLHAITEPFEPARLAQYIYTTAALYLACGVDPARSALFPQSHISAHAELARLLGSVIGVGTLERMTQFKEKSRKGIEASLGLLDYPVLMAGDILLYQADLVPVGADQKQHLELTRDLAERFNRLYGVKKAPIFKLPTPLVMPEAAKIMSLTDGTSKMSKSDPSDYSRINLLDSPEVIARKVKKCKTDSVLGLEYDNPERPEVHNLLTIYQLVSNQTREQVAKECASKGFGQFKPMLVDALVAHLEPIQKRYAQIMSDKNELKSVLNRGREQAEILANQTLNHAKSAMGFVLPD